ncbi:PD-(D/E)XK nuclease family protein [Vulcanisaeta distributa]|uniref:DUF3782 domain-containing protein n=1 Tax=Vulcanisaeta distributa (strain DSM 14429 / JCM 11212 / NBRC 100878 / IC-017) TaxID=572478 RepID=E1QTZ9_VULDI|nr:DUF3782 domain-containing protein [Vulcanisaeta distributa]ADN49796.1 Protein of unknown function DUF1626 [Vulcanisaeta distributa DSM 14429]
MSRNLKDEFLRLLREDEVFRLAVIGFLGISDVQSSLRQLVSVVSDLTRTVQRLVEGQERLWEENNKLWQEVRRLAEGQEALRTDVSKLWEENNKIWQEIKALRENQEKLWENQNKLWQEVKALREEQERRWQENERRWEENNRRWEEAYKRFEVIETELRNLREDFNKSMAAINRRLDALGARWGVISEEAFREGMKGVIERILGTAKVEKWTYNDTNGEVYGHPAIVDVDLVIRDNVHVLVEVKSSISRGDVAEFWRVGRLYERVNGVKPRLVMISPYVDDKAMELARELGIEVYTNVT